MNTNLEIIRTKIINYFLEHGHTPKICLENNCGFRIPQCLGITTFGHNSRELDAMCDVVHYNCSICPHSLPFCALASDDIRSVEDPPCIDDDLIKYVIEKY